NLDGFLYDLVEFVNSGKFREIISLDIPSGVDGDNGLIRGTAVQADLTVSFGFPKLGHFLAPGASKRGELINVDISLPHHFREEGDKVLLNDRMVSQLIQERDQYGHKNAFGHTLLVGGSPGRLGAIEMAGRACHRMGTGLVTISTWDEIFPLLMMRIPSETMAFPIPPNLAELDAPGSLLTGFSSLVVGPGLGQKPEAVKLLESILTNYQGPVVLDADALNIIAENDFYSILVNRRAPTVLTPHLGEMARLLKISVSEIKEDLLTALREAVDRTHSTIVLKGAATLICSPDDRVYLNHYPNDGMATAGSGDVLAGMIGGLLGQGMDAFEAALAGVALHSTAGGQAARTRGHRSMTAGDIIDSISGAFHEIKERKSLAPLPFETRAYLL
ncbi:MAG: NAD(P)H-hydrate dehydratase, partial [Verrucomicrobiaceae bacterium]